MPASQSSPVCAPPGLLLLTIGVISFHQPPVLARPTDFWCDYHARKNMEKRIFALKKDMVRNYALISLYKVSLKQKKRKKVVVVIFGVAKPCCVLSRWTAWVLIRSPLLCSYHVFGYTQQNGQIKLWVLLAHTHHPFVCQKSGSWLQKSSKYYCM